MDGIVYGDRMRISLWFLCGCNKWQSIQYLVPTAIRLDSLYITIIDTCCIIIASKTVSRVSECINLVEISYFMYVFVSLCLVFIDFYFWENHAIFTLTTFGIDLFFRFQVSPLDRSTFSNANGDIFQTRDLDKLFIIQFQSARRAEFYIVYTASKVQFCCIIAVILLVIRAVYVCHLKGSRESILLLLCRSLTCPQPCVPSHMSRKFTKLSILVLHIGGSRI